MFLKILLAALFTLSLLGAFTLAPRPGASRDDKRSDLSGAENTDYDGKRLRLMSWNIGNGDLETETRAHIDDLPAVAQVILDNEPDAVALQELAGEEQLKLLLTHLKNRYWGYASSQGSSDRVEAVLVKEQSERSDRGESGARGSGDHAGVRFNDVPAGDRFAAAARFHPHKNSPVIVLLSAHADAFSAARRRAFAAEVVDWTRSRPKGEIAFIAGDFNFEVSTRNKNNLFTDDAKNDSESYAYLLKYFRDLGLDAGETSINDRRIDYVFGPPQTVSLRRAEVLRAAAIGRMDHWPLLIEVGL